MSAFYKIGNCPGKNIAGEKVHLDFRVTQLEFKKTVNKYVFILCRRKL